MAASGGSSLRPFCSEQALLSRPDGSAAFVQGEPGPPAPRGLPGASPGLPGAPGDPVPSARRRHVGAGRAVRPRRGEGQPGAPGPGGARGAAAAQGGAARGAGAQPGAAAARDVRGRAAGGAAPPLGRHAGAAGAERRRLPALVLPQRRLPGAAGRGGPALRPVLRRHLRPGPRRDPGAGPHGAAGAGRPRRAHVRHRQRGAEGAGGLQQGELLRGGDAALPGGGTARRGLHLRLLPRLRPAEILQILTPAGPQLAVNNPRPPPPACLSLCSATRVGTRVGTPVLGHPRWRLGSGAAL